MLFQTSWWSLRDPDGATTTTDAVGTGEYAPGGPSLTQERRGVECIRTKGRWRRSRFPSSRGFSASREFGLDPGQWEVHLQTRRGLLILAGLLILEQPAGRGRADDETWRIIHYDASRYPGKKLEAVLAEKHIRRVNGFVPQARVEVIKSQYSMNLYSGEELLKVYRIQLGRTRDVMSPKQMVGDLKTPEGTYQVCGRGCSKYFVGLDLNYPNAKDVERGLREGLIDRRTAKRLLQRLASGECPGPSPLGSAIRIHGENAGACEPSAPGHEADVFPGGSRMVALDRRTLNIASNWTNGCIALFNADMQELYQAVPIGTEVDIRVE